MMDKGEKLVFNEIHIINQRIIQENRLLKTKIRKLEERNNGKNDNKAKANK